MKKPQNSFKQIDFTKTRDPRFLYDQTTLLIDRIDWLFLFL
jgi:hypothetical protein